MSEKEIFVYRVEYEKLPTMSSWTAFVAAQSVEEAELYIQKLIGPIRTMSIGMQCRLDALSYEVRDRIVNAYLGKSAAPSIKEVKLGGKAPFKAPDKKFIKK
jgi:hypothetical protein